ncbi:thioester domain-containing protein [Longispora sp. K20-0274]|uniref:thioester domain-containing protein n=1 Tax=Longispora sp. K20-0274 TaxID=3088255 RepID=UPI00399A8A0F
MLVSKLRPVLAAATLGAVAVLGLTTPAFAADPAKGQVVTVPHADGFSISYVHGSVDGGKADDYSTGLIGIKLAGADKAKLAYCIDIKHPLAQYATYKEAAWETASVGNLDRINWLLHNSFPAKPAGEVLTKAGVPTASEAAYVDGATVQKNQYLVYAGTQAAIWHFSDKFSLLGDASEGGFGADFATVKKVYDFLVGVGDAVPAHPTLGITPASSTAKVGDKAGPFTVASSVGEATLAVTGGKAVDKDGKEITKIGDKGQFWLTATEAGTVSVTATATGNTDLGRVFVFDSWPNDKVKQEFAVKAVAGEQKVIIPGSKVETVTAKVGATFTATPTLPVTGAAAAGIAGAGVLLLGAGGALVLMRRRRVKFEA